MKDMLKIYLLINPISYRKWMWMIGFIGIVGSSIIIFMSQTYGWTPYLGFAYTWYFIFLMQSQDVNFLAQPKQKRVKDVLLQMRDQNGIFNTALILQNVLLSICCLLIEGVMLLICIPLFGVHVEGMIICLWITIIPSILSMFFELAQINEHKKISFIFMIILLSVFFLCLNASLTNFTIYIPPFMSALESVPVLLLLWMISVPIANVFGKYCYKTRKEYKQSKFVQLLNKG